MKILVPVKRVADYKAIIRVKSDNSGIDTSTIKMSMNPFDEIALEAALQIKEKGLATEIIAVSIGNETCQETLRTALAMGADRALLIKTAADIYPLAIAKILKFIAEQEQIQLVILGKQAIDSDDNQVGQMLAGLLNWAQATFASGIEFQGQEVFVTREIDGGLEKLALTLPAVITTDLRLNEPRYISLPNIVQAKRKSLTIQPIEELNINVTSNIKTVAVLAPPKRGEGVELKTVKELVEHLKNAQVIG